jgi:predicted TIM-barrel fold metal-dependent hydrolase
MWKRLGPRSNILRISRSVLRGDWATCAVLRVGWPTWAVTLALVVSLARGIEAADYTGPLVDAHSHVSNPAAIDAYVAAMKRHNVAKVLLLGVGGVQKDDPAWIAAAAKKYPDRVLVGLPLADPMADGAAARLDQDLESGRYRAVGEVHVRQVSRKIDRSPEAPPFGRVLEVVARHKIPLVIHFEMTDQAAAALGTALTRHPTATVVLAHAGEGPPARVAALLVRHPNLMVDLSGMHFQRTPALATETGPLDPLWKALIEKMPDRFLMGIDVWAARLFEPEMLDRLMRWTRRILGELSPGTAEQVAYKNAARVYRAGD